MINNRSKSRSIAVLTGVGAGAEATLKKIGAGAEPEFAFFFNRFSSFFSSDVFC